MRHGSAYDALHMVHLAQRFSTLDHPIGYSSSVRLDHILFLVSLQSMSARLLHNKHVASSRTKHQPPAKITNKHLSQSLGVLHGLDQQTRPSNPGIPAAQTHVVRIHPAAPLRIPKHATGPSTRNCPKTMLLPRISASEHTKKGCPLRLGLY